MGNQFYIDNLLWGDNLNSIITSSGVSEGLKRRTLRPGFSSDDRGIHFPLGTERLQVTGAAFNFPNSFAGQLLLKVGSVTGQQYILEKFGVADGFAIIQDGPKFKFILNTGTLNHSELNEVLVIGNSYCITVAYNSTAQTVLWWVDRISSSATVTGTIPAAMVSNASNLTVGMYRTPSTHFQGELYSVAIKQGLVTNGNRWRENDTYSTWNFEDNLSDSSPNSYDLTGVDITVDSYVDSTSQQFIAFNFANPVTIANWIIDRRHNLTSSATVKLWRGSYYSGTPVLIDEPSVLEGKPIVFTSGSVIANTDWFIEINDPTNTNSKINIPLIFLSEGVITTGRGFTIGYTEKSHTFSIINESSNGARTSYVTSSNIWGSNPTWRANDDDKLALENVYESATYAPFVFVPKPGSINSFRVVNLLNQDPFEKTNIHLGLCSINMELREIT